MQMFSIGLQRRSEAGQSGILANAAHAGFAKIELIANGPEVGMMATMAVLFAPIVSQSAAAGALPSLYAATLPDAAPSSYYGPTGFFELKGLPGPAKIMPQARDMAVIQKLWDRAETATGVSFKSAQ